MEYVIRKLSETIYRYLYLVTFNIICIKPSNHKVFSQLYLKIQLLAYSKVKTNWLCCLVEIVEFYSENILNIWAN